MSEESRRRTLQTIASFRPHFHAVTAALTDLDLIFVEEAFERLLLDYDRVFSQMGTPACCASAATVRDSRTQYGDVQARS